MMMQLDSTTGRYGDVPASSVTFKGATLAYRRIDQLERDPLQCEYKRRAAARVQRGLLWTRQRATQRRARRFR